MNIKWVGCHPNNFQVGRNGSAIEEIVLLDKLAQFVAFSIHIMRLVVFRMFAFLHVIAKNRMSNILEIRPMMPIMSKLINKLQVIRAIVLLVVIYVMNKLFWSEFSTKFLFHNNSVYKFSGIRRFARVISNISPWGNMSPSLPIKMLSSFFRKSFFKNFSITVFTSQGLRILNWFTAQGTKHIVYRTIVGRTTQ